MLNIRNELIIRLYYDLKIELRKCLSNISRNELKNKKRKIKNYTSCTKPFGDSNKPNDGQPGCGLWP